MTRRLSLAVIGLTLSSSWGNGHATTYRALLRAFAARGHRVTFLERDQPWYADHRDLPDPDFCRLILYRDRRHLRRFRELIAEADMAIIGSYVAEGAAIGGWVQGVRRGATGFYDIDTPVTLSGLRGGRLDYLSPELVAGYDPYLSFTGGPALETLETRYGAPAARLLYCTADERLHRPLSVKPRFDLGYLGTYSADRQPALERLLVEPARLAPDLSFVVAGPQFPESIDWPANVTRYSHVSPADHPAFYAGCRFTLNVTRSDMVGSGFSPSVRLFEAAACASPVLSDRWPGIENIFTPGREILLVEETREVLAILRDMAESERLALGKAARRRFLYAHSSDQRAGELEKHLLEALARHGRAGKQADMEASPGSTRAAARPLPTEAVVLRG